MIDEIKHLVKLIIRPDYRIHNSQNKELGRISKIPRYTEALTLILGTSLKIVDSASFIFMYKEIFIQEIYKFSANTNNPYILDCGANIGLSVLYYKKLYPDAEIVAFEPDEKVFKTLKYNIESFNYKDVSLINKAIWQTETILKFIPEGADGGRISEESFEENLIEIETVRLKNFIIRHIDLLKIDIEGAETSVIEDIADVLYYVDKIFIEYHSFVNQEQTLDKILNILKRAGFIYYINQVGISSQSPFYDKKIFLGMDNQLNIFASREKKL